MSRTIRINSLYCFLEIEDGAALFHSFGYLRDNYMDYMTDEEVRRIDDEPPYRGGSMALGWPDSENKR